MRNPTIAWGVLCAAACATFAETHPTGVPVLNSRPGAAYTIYLDFAGFSFTGTWLNGSSPGVTPAYANATGAFTDQQQANIANIWARVAEKYAPFNINVTTVDPAFAAGQAGSDAARQAFYDQTPHFMHTVIGGSGAWYGSGGTGVSGIRTDQSSYSTTTNGGAGSGFHTNFVFAGLMPTNLQALGEVVSHENGHGLGASHQVDVSNSKLINAYATNFGAIGNGSYAPVMGSSFSSQRGTWRVGTSDKSGWPLQNDVRTIQTNSGMGDYVDDGIGHSPADATFLPLLGSAVDPAAAKGIIVPASATSPNPIGVENYVPDYFWFRTDGAGTITLSAVDGGSRLTPGVADPGATLRSTLRILDASYNVVATATMSASTLSETFVGTLPAGRYFAEVASAGGFTSATDPTATYFDMGSFFLTGSGFSAAKWTAGATPGEWANAANWLGQVVPQANEGVSIPAGASVAHAGGIDSVGSLTGTGNLNVAGGKLTVDSIHGVGLSVAGMVNIRPSQDGDDTSSLSSLILTGPGTLDVADNRLVIATGDSNSIRSYLRSAYNNGAWDGPGLTSSVVQADSSDRLAIAYATASQLGVSQWGDVTELTGGEILTRIALVGDANLDGVINADDFALVDHGRQMHLTDWIHGDFDYSGTVDMADCWLLDRNFLLQSTTTEAITSAMLAEREAEFGSAYVGSLMASVPEPAGAWIVLAMAATSAGRRRSRRSQTAGPRCF